jgi:hypothetical protein
MGPLQIAFSLISIPITKNVGRVTFKHAIVGRVRT